MSTAGSGTSTQRPNVWWLFLLQGIAGTLLGLMLITYPGASLVALVTFVGFYWLFTGIMALVRIFVDSSVPWIWSLVIGIVGILAGILVLRHPVLAALTVPTTIVIVLTCRGSSWVCSRSSADSWAAGPCLFHRGHRHRDRRAVARLAADGRARGSARLRRADADPGIGTHRVGSPRAGAIGGRYSGAP